MFQFRNFWTTPSPQSNLAGGQSQARPTKLNVIKSESASYLTVVSVIRVQKGSSRWGRSSKRPRRTVDQNKPEWNRNYWVFFDSVFRNVLIEWGVWLEIRAGDRGSMARGRSWTVNDLLVWMFFFVGGDPQISENESWFRGDPNIWKWVGYDDNRMNLRISLSELLDVIIFSLFSIYGNFEE